MEHYFVNRSPSEPNVSYIWVVDETVVNLFERMTHMIRETFYIWNVKGSTERASITDVFQNLDFKSFRIMFIKCHSDLMSDYICGTLFKCSYLYPNKSEVSTKKCFP